MFAIECDRLIVVRDGGVVIGSIAIKDTFFEKRIATIVVSRWILRFQLDYSVIALDRSIEHFSPQIRRQADDARVLAQIDNECVRDLLGSVER